MKNLFLFIFLFVGNILYAQGKFAGSYASLINKNYMNEKELTQLRGFTLREGTLLSNYDDPVKLSASWYIKGTVIVAIFEQINVDNSRVVLDVLEVKTALSNQILSIGVCQDGENINAGFVALVNQTNEERYKAVKAWFFNRDKIRLEPWSAAKVTCIGMVGDD
jgi:hypothetical protein